MTCVSVSVDRVKEQGPAATRVLSVVSSTIICLVSHVVIAAAGSAGRCTSKFRSSPASPPVRPLSLSYNNSNNNDSYGSLH